MFNTVIFCLFIPCLKFLSPFYPNCPWAPSYFFPTTKSSSDLILVSLPLLPQVLVKNHPSAISSISPLPFPIPSLPSGLSISDSPSAMPCLTFQSLFPDKSTSLPPPQLFLTNSALPSHPFLPSLCPHHFHLACAPCFPYSDPQLSCLKAEAAKAETVQPHPRSIRHHCTEPLCGMDPCAIWPAQGKVGRYSTRKKSSEI